jgi:hypothetical protein
MSTNYCDHSNTTTPFCPVCGSAMSGSPDSLLEYLLNNVTETAAELEARRAVAVDAKRDCEFSGQIQELANATRKLEYTDRERAKWSNWAAWVEAKIQEDKEKSDNGGESIKAPNGRARSRARG